MQKKNKSVVSMLNGNEFKIILFSLIFASIIRLLMNLGGHGEWYCVLLERQFSKGQSTTIYYAILAMVLFLYFLTVQERKKWKHIFFIMLVPLSVYIVFFQYKFVWLYGMMIFVAVALTIFDISFLRESYKLNIEYEDEEPIWEYVKEFFWDASKTICGLTVYAAVICLYVVGLVNIVDGLRGEKPEEEPIAYATNVRDLQTTTPENLWEPNQKYLRLLAKDVYCTLDTQERMNALQQLINIECEYLGIESCQLIAEDLIGRNIGGYYRDEDRVISVEYTYVERDESLYGMHVILHEVYHCYQYDCVRGYQALLDAGTEIDMRLKYYRDCAKWANEFEHYKTYSDTGDFAGYYQYASQSIETTANEYRDKWLGPYWEYINNIGKEEKTPKEVLEENG